MKRTRRDRLREKTLEELEAMVQQVRSDPTSSAGATGISILNKKAEKLLDDIAWAIYDKTGGGNRVMQPEIPQFKNW